MQMADALDIVDQKVQCSLWIRHLQAAVMTQAHSYDRLDHSWFNHSSSASTPFATLRNSSRLVSVPACLNCSRLFFEQEYLKDWHPRLIGLTGTPEQVHHFSSFIFCHVSSFLSFAFVQFSFSLSMLLCWHDVASQVAQVARTFRVFFSKAKTGDGPEDYLVDHRSLLFFFLALFFCHILVDLLLIPFFQHHHVSYEPKWGASSMCTCED
jgi:hypothetical protein